MARDAEQERLKADMDAAFEQMNSARNDMNTAWDHRCNLRDQMNETFLNVHMKITTVLLPRNTLKKVIV